MSLSAGQVICNDKYRIVEPIGEGSFGRVWRAYEPGLDRQVAIKQLRRADFSEQEYRQFLRRFQREARIGAALDHPHVVKVHTLECVDDDVLLVLEYVDGGSLKEKLEREGALPTVEAVRIAVEICSGLQAVHSHPLGIVHRDVKPSNVLLTRDGRAKLTDFGLAQLPGESDRSWGEGGLHPGTPLYMSPEQENTRGYLPPAADVYSLGCVLFEMLAGKPYKPMAHQGRALRELRPDVPPWLERAVAKALAEEPRARHANAGEMEAELRKGQAKAKAQRGAAKRARRERAEAALAERRRRKEETRWKQREGLRQRAEVALAARRWADALGAAQQLAGLGEPGRQWAEEIRERAQRGQWAEAQRRRRPAKAAALTRRKREREGRNVRRGWLSPWNPLHWLVLLWWVLVRPDVLGAYRDPLDEEGEKRLKRVGAWLASTLICWPLWLAVLWALPDTGTTEGTRFLTWLYGHWDWVGGAVLLLWLLLGLLDPLVGWFDEGLEVLVAFGVAAVAAFGVVFVVAVGTAGVSLVTAVLDTVFDTAFGTAGVGSGSVAVAVVGLVAFSVAIAVAVGVAVAVASATAVGVAIGVTFGVAFGGVALTTLSAGDVLFVAVGVAYLLAAPVTGIVAKVARDGVKTGCPSWLARWVFGVLALSHAVLLWQMLIAWGWLP